MAGIGTQIDSMLCQSQRGVIQSNRGQKMSVEGMWVMVSGVVEDLAQLNVTNGGGIIVLETGRVFGGDSVMAHVGEYEVAGGQLTANVRSWNWNPVEGYNVFGMETPIDHNVSFQGTIGDGIIEGQMTSDQQPGATLPIVLKKITDLP